VMKYASTAEPKSPSIADEWITLLAMMDIYDESRIHKNGASIDYYVSRSPAFIHNNLSKLSRQ
jgi:hypothetical protein